MPSPPAPRSTAADLVMRSAVRMLGPIVRLLVTYGITYPQLTGALKRLYADAAREELLTVGRNPTDTAVSVLSGLHRKDVKLLSQAVEPPLAAAAERPSLATQVATRWMTVKSYLDERGEPRPLPLRASGRGASFERLVDAVSTDVHASAVADELVRLKLATFDGTTVCLLSHSFVPPNALAENLPHFSDSVRDQLSAGVANLHAALAGKPPMFLEYSLFSDELRKASVDELHTLAKSLWREAFKRATDEAVRLSDQDRALGFSETEPEMRMRFGVFFYAEPQAPSERARATAPGKQ